MHLHSFQHVTDWTSEVFHVEQQLSSWNLSTNYLGTNSLNKAYHVTFKHRWSSITSTFTKQLYYTSNDMEKKKKQKEKEKTFVLYSHILFFLKTLYMKRTLNLWTSWYKQVKFELCIKYLRKEVMIKLAMIRRIPHIVEAGLNNY